MKKKLFLKLFFYWEGSNRSKSERLNKKGLLLLAFQFYWQFIFLLFFFISCGCKSNLRSLNCFLVSNIKGYLLSALVLSLIFLYFEGSSKLDGHIHSIRDFYALKKYLGILRKKWICADLNTIFFKKHFFIFALFKFSSTWLRS